ncbi:MAG: HPr family phosphocarrier protein [Negativicutes bacterium]|nr:HPr family phosphocarrier protein [Negativicutes bacterium]
MYSKTVVVQNKTGLHARPAAIFVQAAQRFNAKITITKDERSVDAKSILKVLSLGVGQGKSITIAAEGADEQAAVEALAGMIEAQQE